jgi:ATP-dependent protease ClpP protease subunit
MDIAELLQPKPLSVWDKYVPIIETPTGFRAYLTDEVAAPGEYNELCDKIITAQRHQTIELYINTPGGTIDSALMVIDAIAATKAKVTAHLSGTVASAGTILALACPKIEVPDSLIFMIHNYSAGAAGKGHEMKARQEFIDRHLGKVFKGFYEGFLTSEEITEVIDGKDMWLSGEEVRERLQLRSNFKRGV